MIKNTEFKGFENKKMFPVTPHMEVVSMLRENEELERWWQDMTGKKIMEKEFKLKKRKITFEMRKTTLKEKLEFLLAIVIIAVIVYWLKK